MKRNQKWPEAGMRKCEVIFAQALNLDSGRKACIGAKGKTKGGQDDYGICSVQAPGTFEPG